jgi:hypothetical protein
MPTIVESISRYRVGQLVRIRSDFATSSLIDLWPGPPFLEDTDLPIRQIEDGTYALVLEGHIHSYKVLADGVVGWIDKRDLDDL